jgi:Acyl-protein synthetase, LuxE
LSALERIAELAGALRAAASAWASGDAYDEDQATRLRHRAIAACHAHYRAAIPAYRRMCDDAGVGGDATFATIVESCTVGDDWFKSYDATWLEAGNFGAMGRWLGDSCAEGAAGVAAAGAVGIDDWLDRLERAGVHVLYSSGTSGKLSFVPRGPASWESYTANGPSYLMARLQRMSLDLSAMDAVVLGFRGGRMGIQRAGVEIARWVPRVEYLYDFELRADALRATLRARALEEARRAHGTLGMAGAVAGDTDGREAAYARVLGACRRATEAGRPVWLFGAPYQVKELCARAEAARTPRFAPGSVVTLGGGWKSFEGDRVERAVLAATIEDALGVGTGRVMEAYSMVELNSPLMCCEAERFHVPPLLEPLVYDEALVPRAPGPDVTGVFGFLDPTATSYPGFVVTGDEVRLVREPCPCGLVGPAIVGEVRRAPGREVRGCGGVLATVRA